MRVLTVGHLFPPYDLGGGYELVWQASVLDLRRRGERVRVLTSDHRTPAVPAQEEDVHRELRLYWEDHAFPRRTWRARLAIERHNAAVLHRHLDEFDPHAVAWWSMGSLSLGLLEAVRRRGIPAVGIVGDEWMLWGPRVDAWTRSFARRPRLGALAERLTGLPTRPAIDDAAVWLFNSEHLRSRVRAAGLAVPRSTVCPPGVDHARFAARPPHPWRWRLLSLGRLDPRKGVDVAIRALAALPHAATLTVQGRGEEAYAERLRGLAHDLGVADRVRFTAHPRDALAEVYAAADAVLFPVQWDEPWGLVPLEAMAVGRPVVASGTGGSREYLRHEGNCLVYEPRDSAEAVAAAVRRLADDESLRERLRRAGHETAATYGAARFEAAVARALAGAAGRG